MGNDKVSESQLSAHIVDCCPPLQTKREEAFDMSNIVVRHLEGLRRSYRATKCTHTHTLRDYGSGMVNEFQLSAHMVNCCPPKQTKTEEAFNL